MFTVIRHRHHSRGQSLVEFTLVLPLLILLTLIAIDFGRIYLGSINLQNMARIGANYAALHPTAWNSPGGDSTAQGIYQAKMLSDAAAINCQLPEVLPIPAFPGGKGLLGSARVELTCSFGVITPLISIVVGDAVEVGASAEFPVRTGMVAFTGGGGSLPVADFTASPASGSAPLLVTFTDSSSGVPRPYAWSWDFGDGGTSADQNPTHTYSDPGTYTVSLVATSAIGPSEPATSSISVVAANDVEFSGAPTTGNAPLNVDFTDESAGTPITYSWSFGDGQSSSAPSPSHTYTAAGTYTVALTVTFDTGPLTLQKKKYVVVDPAVCRVPIFTDTGSDSAQTTWTDAGFSTIVQFQQQNSLPYTVGTQSVVGNSIVPCDSPIRLGP